MLPAGDAPVIPTRRFWWLVAAGIPVAAVCAQLEAPQLAVMYNVLLLAGAAISWRLAPDGRAVRVRRSFDPVLSVRVANRIDLAVSNEGLEPVKGVMREEPPPEFETSTREFALALAPGGTRELHYTVIPHSRGSDYFRGSFLRLACPLGLVERVFRLPTEQPVRVYPNVLALLEFELLRQKGHLHTMGIRRSRIRGLGTEFESLREYTEGDDFRKIDWMATARRGKLVVKNFEQERNQAVILCVDMGRRMLAEVEGVRKLDHVLDAMLLLADAETHAGDFVGVLVYADTVRRYIPPRKGRNTLGAIIEAVHDLVAEPVESDPAGAFAYLASRWKRRSLLVSFTDVDEPELAKSVAAAMGPLASRHLALVARVSDPRLKEAAHLTLSEPSDLYLRAAALELHAERRQAGSTLVVHKVHALDAEPQELASALVSYYFEVKERGML